MVPRFHVRRYTWVLPLLSALIKGHLCSGSAAVVRSQGLHLIKPLTGLRSKIE